MKKISFLSLFIVGSLAVLLMSLASCGSKGCSKANCAGCCTSANACEAGTQNAACGAAGNLCSACATGQTCQLGVCKAGGTGGGSGTGTGGGSGTGTGGGSGTGTGGGSGTGTGGGSGACRMVTGLVAEPSGGFLPRDGGTIGDVFVFASGLGVNANRFDVVTLELYYPGNAFPAAPRTTSLGATTYNDCADCLIYDSDCDQTGNNCSKSYLGQAGSLNITAQHIGQTDGGVTGTVTNARFVDWDFNSDVAASSDCIQVQTIPYDGHW